MPEQSTKAQVTVTTAVPPYVPYRSFRNFIDSLKQGIPSRIDRSVMPSMSGALQSQLTAGLRYLGLINAVGQPTQLLSRLVNSEGPERANVMKSILESAYRFLLPPFELETATPRMVEEAFATAGASGGTISKCVNFFLSAAKEANLDLSPHLRNNRNTRASRPRQRMSREQAAQPNGIESNGAMSADISTLSWEQMLLSKFPSFDPSWSPEVQAKWFDMFGKLMKQGEEGQEK